MCCVVINDFKVTTALAEIAFFFFDPHKISRFFLKIFIPPECHFPHFENVNNLKIIARWCCECEKRRNFLWQFTNPKKYMYLYYCHLARRFSDKRRNFCAIKCCYILLYYYENDTKNLIICIWYTQTFFFFPNETICEMLHFNAWYFFVCTTNTHCWHRQKYALNEEYKKIAEAN
jgi:hypothetical protein